ncbi:unnamed protein product [Caenorhabditis bovis]|uniref:Uncharacterized protein n=1 Tax=Caenorhabditis bovis TaxID=2654633 RepID=A0A8S1FFW1_9PELO|nr:unnamed protein product [Caenorhabditis bovis]
MDPECRRFWDETLCEIGRFTMNMMSIRSRNNVEDLNASFYIHMKLSELATNQMGCLIGNHQHAEALEIFEAAKLRYAQMRRSMEQRG